MWSSFSEFIDMGGYGFFVWMSFGVCALAFLIEGISVYTQFIQAKKKWHQHAAHQTAFKKEEY